MHPIVTLHRRNATLCGLLIAALTTFAAPASAHHGWEWAEAKQTTLEGRIETISMAPPHPRLQVKAVDGSTWQIDLGNPSQTERSGFRADSAAAGDRITVLGNRAKDASRRQMKAVRITVDGRRFDMYPERIASP